KPRRLLGLPRGRAAETIGEQTRRTRPAPARIRTMRWDTPEEVGRLLFSPSGLLLATTRYCGDDEGRDVLRLWDPGRWRELAHLDDLNPVWSLGFTSERTLAVVEERRFLNWDPDAGAARTLWEAPGDPAWRAARRFTGGKVSPDGRTLALALE